MYLTLVKLILQADYAAKRYMEDNLAADGRRKEVLGGKMALRLLKNPGAAGGLMGDEPEKVRNLTTALTMAGMTGYLVLLGTKGHHGVKLGTALVLGGSLGNVYDRWANGKVTDYLSTNTGRLRKLDGIVFNLADVFIVLGTGIAAVSLSCEK